MVEVICPSRYKVNRKLIKDFVTSFLKENQVPDFYQINIIFIGRNKMKTISQKYKGENIALPVLSFRYDQEKDNVFGEIFVCYPQMILLAAEKEKKIDDILIYLIKHGLENLLKRN